MQYRLTEEQSILRDTLRSFLSSRYDFEARRKALQGQGWRPEIWKAFARELGLLGAGFSEAAGGFGGGFIENVLIMEELGRALVLEPYLQTAVIAGGLLQSAGGPRSMELISEIIEGKSLFAFAQAEPQSRYSLRDVKTSAKRTSGGWQVDGQKSIVIGAPIATHLIVTVRTSHTQWEDQGLSLIVVPASARGVDQRTYRTVDGRLASEVSFSNVAVSSDDLIGTEGGALPLIEAAVDQAVTGICSEAVGCMSVMHEQTVDYARQRKQFGQAIGSFQALQHRMVDMYMEIEQATSLVQYAATHLASPAAERSQAVSAAKFQAAKACRFVGQNAIQIHGGMGMTDELAVGHYFKRTTVIEGEFGSSDHHLQRYTDLAAVASTASAA